jgi:hypothetical protein
MTEHHVARRGEMIVNLQAYPRPDEQPREQHLAPCERLAPQILPVELEQIERIQQQRTSALIAASLRWRRQRTSEHERLAPPSARVNIRCTPETGLDLRAGSGGRHSAATTRSRSGSGCRRTLSPASAEYAPAGVATEKC